MASWLRWLVGVVGTLFTFADPRHTSDKNLRNNISSNVCGKMIRHPLLPHPYCESPTSLTECILPRASKLWSGSQRAVYHFPAEQSTPSPHRPPMHSSPLIKRPFPKNTETVVRRPSARRDFALLHLSHLQPSPFKNFGRLPYNHWGLWGEGLRGMRILQQMCRSRTLAL